MLIQIVPQPLAIENPCQVDASWCSDFLQNVALPKSQQYL